MICDIDTFGNFFPFDSTYQERKILWFIQRVVISIKQDPMRFTLENMQYGTRWIDFFCGAFTEKYLLFISLLNYEWYLQWHFTIKESMNNSNFTELNYSYFSLPFFHSLSTFSYLWAMETRNPNFGVLKGFKCMINNI
jgi:hypothetical protein